MNNYLTYDIVKLSKEIEVQTTTSRLAILANNLQYFSNFYKSKKIEIVLGIDQYNKKELYAIILEVCCSLSLVIIGKENEEMKNEKNLKLGFR
jgi:hypothetical protein